MSVHDTAQLELARSIVEAREQRLGVELAELVRQHAAAQQMLARLVAYLEEYNAADRSRDVAARSPHALLNGRHFVRRLGVAIARQRSEADRLTERATLKLAQWNKARAELSAIGQVIDRRRRQAARLEERRVQRELDGQASRRAAALDRHGHALPSAGTRIMTETGT